MRIGFLSLRRGEYLTLLLMEQANLECQSFIGHYLVTNFLAYLIIHSAFCLKWSPHRQVKQTQLAHLE